MRAMLLAGVTVAEGERGVYVLELNAGGFYVGKFDDIEAAYVRHILFKLLPSTRRCEG